MNCRLLIVIPAFLPNYESGGPIRSVAGLLEGLKEYSGISCEVLCLSPSKDFEGSGRGVFRRRVNGFNVIYMKPQFVILVTTIARLLRSRGYSYICVNGVFNLICVCALSLAVFFKKKVALFPRGSLLKGSLRQRRRDFKELTVNLFYSSLFLSLNLAILSSKREEEDFRKLIGSRSIRTVRISNPIYFEPEEISSMGGDLCPGRRKQERYILYLGRFHPSKRLALIEELALQTPDFDFVFAGYPAGYEFGYGEVSENIDVIDAVHGVDKLNLIKNAAMTILIGEHENFGNSLAESVVLGTPVVTLHSVGFSDHIQEFGGGIVASHASVDCLAEAVLLCWDTYGGTLESDVTEYYAKSLSQAYVASKLVDELALLSTQ